MIRNLGDLKYTEISYIPWTKSGGSGECGGCPLAPCPVSRHVVHGLYEISLYFRSPRLLIIFEKLYVCR